MDTVHPDVMDVVIGRKLPDDLGAYKILATVDGVTYGMTVSRFLARCNQEMALQIARESCKHMPHILGCLEIAGVCEI